MKQPNRFTSIEVMVVVAILLIFASIILSVFGNFIVNNPAMTEARAYEHVNTYITKNGIEVKRLTCAHDNDGDGYGSCTILEPNGNKIFLDCPTDWLTTSILNATSCKELDTTIKFNARPKL